MKEVDLSETLLVVTADHSHVLTLGGLATHRGNPIFGKWNVISHCPIIPQSIEATLKWFITRHSIPIIPNKTSSIRKLLFIESLLKLKIHLLLLYLILPPYRIRWNGFIISSRFRAEKLPTDNMDFHIHRYDAISMNNSIVVSSFEVSEWNVRIVPSTNNLTILSILRSLINLVISLISFRFGATEYAKEGSKRDSC